METAKKRILTGDRTTGRLHLGHYVGSLKSRVELQDAYDTFILLADIQALTTHFEHPELLHESIFDVAIDNLSVGIRLLRLKRKPMGIVICPMDFSDIQ